MKLHEYQAKQILKKHGVNLPEGIAVTEIGMVEKACRELGIPVAVKSQVHAGGRGKGKIYSGEDPSSSELLQEGGVKVATSAEDARKFTEAMLGNYIITHQTAGTGKKISTVYLEKGTEIAKEFYLSILVDRTVSKPIFMVSTEGGMDIEEVAAKTPEKIFKIEVEPALGIQPWQIRELLFHLEVPKEAHKQGAVFFKKLWKAYDEEDASMLEINPLVLTKTSELIALDCKLSIDDNALYRHPDTAAMRDITEEDPLEVEASEYNLNYIKLDGNVGCMVNGAGLAMATMDIVKLAGAEPANFLDVGGGANVETVSNGFKIILGDPHVKAIFVNIFGGIVQCDRVANGIVEAAKNVNITVPLVVRLRGTNADLAREILDKSGLSLKTAEELGEAAKLVAQSIQ
ncbi:MAG: ADP-forming succinate--CoA ligase subunit beta [Spirochaetia bacterium]|nr:ADP-forming succinate--CoA ligase subunit beta [Spirochaetia bacterium]